MRKSKKEPTIYITDNGRYLADTCDPLIDARDRGVLDLHLYGRKKYPGQLIPDGTLKQLNSIGYWDAKKPQDWGLGWHRNEGIELTYLETGSMPMSIGNQEIDMRPGDLVITRPWQKHKLGNPNIGIGRLHWIILDVDVRFPNQKWSWPDWIVLDPGDLEEFTKIIRQTEYITLAGTNNIRMLFEKMATILASGVSSRTYSRKAIVINDILLTILEELSSQKLELSEQLTSTQRSVELFLGHVQENVQHPWTLEELANECGLGVTSFVRYCKQITNRSPMIYLNECRLEQAKEVLTMHPAASITEVALHCGFSSSQYFATQFKKHFNMTPREWKQYPQSP